MFASLQISVIPINMDGKIRVIENVNIFNRRSEIVFQIMFIDFSKQSIREVAERNTGRAFANANMEVGCARSISCFVFCEILK